MTIRIIDWDFRRPPVTGATKYAAPRLTGDDLDFDDDEDIDLEEIDLDDEDDDDDAEDSYVDDDELEDCLQRAELLFT